MMIQSSQRLAAAPLQPAQRALAAQGDCAAESAVLIGQLDLQPKDATVLRALIRLLDGSLGMPLRHCEDPRVCHLVFVAGSVPAGCAERTAIWVQDPQQADPAPPGAICVPSPLRIGAVIAALQQAFVRLRPQASTEQVQSLSTLFLRLQQALGLGGPSALPLGAGQLVLIDAGAQQLRASVPIDGLLTQGRRIGELRPAHGFDEQRLRGAPAHCLRSWLWRLSAHMLSAEAAHPPLNGAWRLRRWPHAAGLTAPGHPQWAARLARRPASVAELAQRSAAPLASVLAFMATCQALGLLQAHTGAVAPDASPSTVAPPNTGWLQQMRVALGLW